MIFFQPNYQLYSISWQLQNGLVMCIVSIYFQTLFYLFSLFAICLTQTCYEQFNVQLCDIDISVHPIAQLPQTQRLGESLETCLGYFKAFNWDIGIYCSALKFCGLGLDLWLDYRSYWNREEFTPADTTCKLLRDVEDKTCDNLIHGIRLSGLFSS